TRRRKPRRETACSAARGPRRRSREKAGTSIDVHDIAAPFDLAYVERTHQDRIEAARRLAAEHREVAVRRGDEARALAGRDAFGGAAMLPGAAHAHFDE